MHRRCITAAVLCLAVLAVVCHPGWAQQAGGATVPQPSSATPKGGLVVTPAPLEIPAAARRPDRTLQMGHTGQITAIAFSPGRQRLATGGDDGTVRVWDLASGQEQLTLAGDQKIVTAVAFSPDGGRLATGSADGKFTVTDASTGKPVYSRDFHQWVDAVAFSPDGQYLAVSIQQSEEEEQSSASIQIYRADTGQEFRTVPLSWNSALQLVITPDNLLISSGLEGEDDPTNVWDIASGQLVKTLPIEAQAISPDGRWAATQEFEQSGKVALWELKTGRQAWVAPSPYGRIYFAFSPDGQQLLLADLNHSAMKLWETANHKEIVTFPASQAVVRNVVFSGDAKSIAAGAADGSVAIWDATTARRVQFLPAQVAVAAVAFTSQGDLLAGDAQGLVLWNTSAGKVLKRISDRPVTNMIASADGSWLAANPDYQLAVWNAHSWQPAALAPPSTARTFYAAFGGTQPPAAEIANPAVSWSRISDDPQKRIVWRSFNPLAISPDGKLLATSFTRGGDVAIWDTRTGEKLRTISSGNLGASCLSFSPDGHWLLTGGQITPFRPGVNLLELKYGFELWDVSNWSQRSLPMAITGGAAAAFSPSGRLLALGTSAAVIAIFDLSQDKTVQTLAGTDPLRSGFFVFSPDGKWLAQPGRKGVSLWGLAEP